MEKTTRFVGLDVHKASIAVAVADAFGDPEDHGQIANDPSAVRKLIDRLGGADAHLAVAYEAGPTGYALHRQLTAMGIDCIVVAPSLIPTRPGDRVKTDRRDAAKLARLLRSGDLTPVWVPDEAHEALRDLVRDRDDAKQDLLRAKHRLSKFLLRHGIHPPAGVQAWGRAHEAWLNRLTLDHRADQVVFDDYWSVVRDGKDRVAGSRQPSSPAPRRAPTARTSPPSRRSAASASSRRLRSSPRPVTCAGSRPPGHSWPTRAWSPRNTRAAPRATGAGSPRPATGSFATSWARRPTTPATGRT
jgi:hypothetical protein